MYATPATGDALLRPTIPPHAEGVVSVLRRAADETGSDFSYLLRTAMRESSLNPKAQAATSSATGLFQFIEQTWLGTVKRHGAEHGLKTYADAIEVGSNGRYKVTDPALRQEILSLRKDAETAALMAGELTNQTRAGMEADLGRGVSAGELYVAHFLGPKAATKLIKAAETSPQASAASLFPQAAGANRSIFYERSGAARSVERVLAQLTSKHGDIPAGDTMPAAPVETALARSPAPERPVAAPVPAEAPGPVALALAGERVRVMAPIMVQLLASLDPLPSLASTLFNDEPQLRRSSADLI
jgi:hypothetical protein